MNLLATISIRRVHCRLDNVTMLLLMNGLLHSRNQKDFNIQLECRVRNPVNEYSRTSSAVTMTTRHRVTQSNFVGIHYVRTVLGDDEQPVVPYQANRLIIPVTSKATPEPCLSVM